MLLGLSPSPDVDLKSYRKLGDLCSPTASFCLSSSQAPSALELRVNDTMAATMEPLMAATLLKSVSATT